MEDLFHRKKKKAKESTQKSKRKRGKAVFFVPWCLFLVLKPATSACSVVPSTSRTASILRTVSDFQWGGQARPKSGELPSQLHVSLDQFDLRLAPRRWWTASYHTFCCSILPYSDAVDPCFVTFAVFNYSFRSWSAWSSADWAEPLVTINHQGCQLDIF